MEKTLWNVRLVGEKVLYARFALSVRVSLLKLAAPAVQHARGRDMLKHRANNARKPGKSIHDF
jgi:hypothetical protein